MLWRINELGEIDTAPDFQEKVDITFGASVARHESKHSRNFYPSFVCMCDKREIQHPKLKNFKGTYKKI